MYACGCSYWVTLRLFRWGTLQEQLGVWWAWSLHCAVSGCDSGFGHALVQKLDSIGMKVFAGFLEKDGIGAVELKNKCSDRWDIYYVFSYPYIRFCASKLLLDVELEVYCIVTQELRCYADCKFYILGLCQCMRGAFFSNELSKSLSTVTWIPSLPRVCVRFVLSKVVFSLCFSVLILILSLIL